MNIETVNELIQSLESAGELSIKETKVMALAKAFKQLAAENVALKSAITDHSHSVHFCEVCGKDDPCSTDDVCYALKETPATDRIVAGIKADGVEEFAAKLRIPGDDPFMDAIADSVAGAADSYAKQLREGAK
ncbi:hypothetical protein [Klebsiella grimontii]|uniref:hypothetical protein n=1 Tax=Klebsiella grimontii TaxID=2058152 RepID=UPI001BCCA6A6|nr:hypothetical protein [Klebsiella grimontii]